MRLLTWNIHGCVGTDGRHAPDRIAEVIDAVTPDLIALQELDVRRDDAGAVFASLNDHLGDHVVEARTLQEGVGWYGHVFASRWPVVDVEVHDLSVRRREPRKAIEATVATPGGRLRVVAVHLGLQRAERRQQLARLRPLIERRDPASVATLLVGDVNDWPWSRITDWRLRGAFRPSPAPPTFPAGWPVLALDRVWCRPHSLLQSVDAERRWPRASDHLPLVAELAL